MYKTDQRKLGEDFSGNSAKKVKAHQDVRMLGSIIKFKDGNTVSNGRQLNDKRINFAQMI